MIGVIHIDKALAGTKEENTKTGKRALHMGGADGKTQQRPEPQHYIQDQ